MEKIIVFILTFCFLVSCAEQQAKTTVYQSNTDKAKDGLFLHVSSGYENPKKALMAVSLANIMANTQDVVMFFDIDGVNLLTKTSDNIEQENYLSLMAGLDSLATKGVHIMVCPMCLKAAGFSEEDLIENVHIADKEKFFQFTEGRILSLDY